MKGRYMARTGFQGQWHPGDDSYQYRESRNTVAPGTKENGLRKGLSVSLTQLRGGSLKPECGGYS